MREGIVVWLTGLPSSGKSTLAARVSTALGARGTPNLVLDGDEVRAALVPAHGYDDRGRADFYETLARLAALLAAQGQVVLVAATASRAAFRARARQLAPRFVEVHVDVPIEECARRDAKGLYAAGAVALPGRDETYEPPRYPELVVAGAGEIEVARVLEAMSR